jgi:hypothetical protein
MPNTASLSAFVASLLQGRPFGEIWPPRPNPRAPSKDGRTIALEILAEYIADLTFYRPMKAGCAPQPFNIPTTSFFIEWPDDVVEQPFPAIAVIPGRADYRPIGLTSYVEESTRDMYGKGTVVQWQVEHVETFQLEVHAARIPDRRAIIAGLETAFVPTEQLSGLRFRMPEYYNELVRFVLNGKQLLDDQDAGRSRRKVRFELEMAFNIVALVNYVPLQPVVDTALDVEADNVTPVDTTQGPLVSE